MEIVIKSGVSLELVRERGCSPLKVISKKKIEWPRFMEDKSKIMNKQLIYVVIFFLRVQNKILLLYSSEHCDG